MNKIYTQVCIVGGGLAGLCSAIDLKLKGFNVLLIERKAYPYHKVCGEYISLESWNYLIALGINLPEMQLPIIKKLSITGTKNIVLKTTLPLGGFGISRYTLDNLLVQKAKDIGVQVLENEQVHKIENINIDNYNFEISCKTFLVHSSICIASYGKRSNLDKELNRTFIARPYNKLHNWIGVKYHIQYNFAQDEIALHNFENGYCGISKVDDNKYCLCYLTTAQNLSDNNNDIKKMESNVLSKNKQLAHIFKNAIFLYDKPLVISQIDFNKKTQTENNILMLGDAAGLITPLCGNGMSMAMKSAYIASAIIKNNFVDNKFNLNNITTMYKHQWQKFFSSQLFYGRLLQKAFGKIYITNFILLLLNKMPKILNRIISKTHGHDFYKN